MEESNPNILKIGLDIDDVLASFLESYIEKYGEIKNDSTITKNVYKLRKNKQFWLGLYKLRSINFIPELYCTKRINSKSITRTWLNSNGFPDRPIYQMYYQKGDKSTMIKGKIDVFIDDSVSNFIKINKAGIPCLLMNAKHNENFTTDMRVDNLNYETILNKYNEIWKSK